MKFFKDLFKKKEEVEARDYRVSTRVNQGEDVVVKTTVPHLNGVYGKKGEIFLLKSHSGKKTEKEAFKEYISLKEKFSAREGFTISLSDVEALEFFADRKILSVENSSAGLNPVQCAGGGIFSLEGGIFLDGYSGSGHKEIERVYHKNNSAVGKTVGEAFLGVTPKVQDRIKDKKDEDLNPEVLNKYWHSPDGSHTYEYNLIYTIDGKKYSIVIVEASSEVFGEISNKIFPKHPILLDDLKRWSDDKRLILSETSLDEIEVYKKNSSIAAWGDGDWSKCKWVVVVLTTISGRCGDDWLKIWLKNKGYGKDLFKYFLIYSVVKIL